MKELYEIISTKLDYRRFKNIRYFSIIGHYRCFIVFNRSQENIFRFQRRMINNFSLDRSSNLKDILEYFVSIDDVLNYKAIMRWPEFMTISFVYHFVLKYQAYRIYRLLGYHPSSISAFQDICRKANLKMIKYEITHNRNIGKQHLANGLVTLTTYRCNQTLIMKYLLKQFYNKIEKL